MLKKAVHLVTTALKGWMQNKVEVIAASIIRMMMEAARTSETSVNFYQTTRRYNPEDSNLRTRRRENPKSYRI
jgi:hypothetical protein